MPLVCFASPKGGVGKSVLAANTAAELRRLGGRVIALDADPQDTLGLHFGLGLEEARGYIGALQPDADPQSWRGYVWNTACGVGLLPYGRTSMAASLERSTDLAEEPEMLAGPVRDMLADPAVIVVADLPPGASGALAALAPMTDLLVTVLLVDAMSLAQIPMVENGRFYGPGTQAALDEDRLAYALNQYDPRTRLGRACHEAATRHFGHRLLGVVYRDENVPEAVAAQQLVRDYAPTSKAAADIQALSRAIAARLAPTRAAATALFGGPEAA